MSFSPLDSELLGPLFRTEAMAAVFSDVNLLAVMLRIEAALARAQARHGLVPAALADTIAAIDPASLDIAVLGQGTALAGVPAIPFVKAVQKRLPAELESLSKRNLQTQLMIETPYRNTTLLGALLATLQPATRLSVSCGLTLPEGWSRSDSVAGWRKGAVEMPNDVPAVFALLAS